MKPIRLQVVGRMRSGKDSVFSILKEAFPCVDRIAYADVLKEEVQEILQISYQVMVNGGIAPNKALYDTCVKDKANNRVMLIDYGTGIIRNKHNTDEWYNQTVKANKDTLVNGNYIITDTRFPNELNRQKSTYNTKTLLIMVDDEVLWNRYKVSFPTANHDEYLRFYNSTTEQLTNNVNFYADYDIKIFNNGTYEEFRANVIREIRDLFAGE